MKIIYMNYRNLDVSIVLNNMYLNFFSNGYIVINRGQATKKILMHKRFAGRASPGAPAPVESNPETKSKGVTQT